MLPFHQAYKTEHVLIKICTCEATLLHCDFYVIFSFAKNCYNSVSAWLM